MAKLLIDGCTVDSNDALNPARFVKGSSFDVKVVLALAFAVAVAVAMIVVVAVVKVVVVVEVLLLLLLVLPLKDLLSPTVQINTSHLSVHRFKEYFVYTFPPVNLIINIKQLYLLLEPMNPLRHLLQLRQFLSGLAQQPLLELELSL